LVGKSEWRRQLGRLRRRCRYVVTMDVKEIVWEFVSGFIWLRAGEHRNEPSVSIRDGEFLD
jgi:hypothetical protein